MMLVSTLTSASQTTPPALVRELLHLQPGDKLGYVIEGDEVRLINASAEGAADPVLEKFLLFLARDAEHRPETIGAMPASLLARARELRTRIAIDHNVHIDGAIDL